MEESLEDPSERAPRSARWPWTRAGLAGLLAALLPVTWIVRIEGCAQTVQGTRTGVDLLRGVQLSLLDLGLLLFLGVLVLATPRWAGLVDRARARLGLHIAGLVATASLVLHGLSVVFGGTEVRAVQPAGYLVLGALLAGLGDAMVRVALGVAEWGEERRSRLGRDASVARPASPS